MLSKEYLEKIIQKPVILPAIEQVYIDQFLDIYLDGSIRRTLIIDILQKYPTANWNKIFVDPTHEYFRFQSGLTEKKFDFVNDNKDRALIVSLWKTSKNNLFDVIQISPPDRKIFENDFPGIYQSQLRKLFTTLRRTKRFLNGLYSALPPIKNEVNVYDFVLLEVIRIFYPNMYDDIWQKPWFYIPVDWSTKTIFLSPFRILNEKDKYDQIKTYIMDRVKNEENTLVLVELLKSLFFEVNNALRGGGSYTPDSLRLRQERRISHPECFVKYFTLKVSPLEISDEYLKATLDIWNSSSGNLSQIVENVFTELQQRGKLVEFFDKLAIFLDNIDRSIVPTLIKIIYKQAPIYSRKDTLDLFSSEFDRANSLLLWLINDKITQDKIHETLAEVITNVPDLSFMTHVVWYCRKDKGKLFNIYGFSNYDELKKLAGKRLREYFIVGKRDIFKELERDWAFVLGQWATNWDTNEADIKISVNEYVFSLLAIDAKQFAAFLMAFKIHPTGEGYTFSLGEIARVYELSRIKELAEKFKDETSLSEREKQSINLFLQLYANKFHGDKN